MIGQRWKERVVDQQKYSDDDNDAYKGDQDKGKSHGHGGRRETASVEHYEACIDENYELLPSENCEGGRIDVRLTGRMEFRFSQGLACVYVLVSVNRFPVL